MNENPIMHIYYTNRTVLGFMCLFNELFYAALYLVYFTPGPTSEFFFLSIDSPSIIIFIFTFAVLGVSSFKLLAIISAPIAIVKTLISVIHGIVASVNITTLDMKERENAKKPDQNKKAE
jgi:CDP-diacylglycerol--inositol 3-phosphatidyltransferase